jgi:hypothetical protein
VGGGGGGGNNFSKIHFIIGVPSLNFNQVIIMKTFHNVFAYYGRSKPKEKKCQINCTFFCFSYDVMLKYLCQNNIHQNVLKKTKYVQNLIEMIFQFHGICNIY